MFETWLGADELSCVSIGYLEVRAAIARRLPTRARPRARRLLDEYWQAVETVAVGDTLLALAARAADTHGLRALDALHLAAAQEIQEPELVFVTWDEELGRAAQAAGFAIAPAGVS
jgi:uncharacterized protein